MDSNFKPICPKDRCSGCIACYASCTHGAIEIKRDELGFEYPMINKDKCVGCNLCYRTCPELNPRTLIFPQKAYAAATDKEIIKEVASGGAATAIATQVIKNGGIVVGSSGEDIHNVKHIIVRKESELHLLMGSKYVQSKIEKDLLIEVRKELLAGTYVCFFGTGCQTAGLQNFLRKEYENLLTVDLVCHGVPSQQLLNQNIALYRDIDLKAIRFRNKELTKKGICNIEYGFNYRNKLNGKEKFIPYYKDPYMSAFISRVSLRPSCSDCRYAYSSRQSDLTIADFWGLSPKCSLTHNLGVSLLLVNNKKGLAFLINSDLNLKLEERPISEAVRGNGQLKAPAPVPSGVSNFISLYRRYGLKIAANKLSMKHLKRKFLLIKIKSKIKTLI